MIESVTVQGRPASAIYLKNGFEPTDKASAEMVKVIFTDDEGGSMFLVPSEPKKDFKMPKKDVGCTPQPDEDYSDFMDRCMGQGYDDDECQLFWGEGAASARDMVRKEHVTEGTGFEFVLSDATVDRLGDVIEPKGWDLSHFTRNPIALFNHDHDFVIGRWTDVRVKDGALRAKLVLAEKGTSTRIDEIRSLVDQGILRATSVGFKPLAHEPMKESSGIRYTRNELLETSLVSVPANPNALQVMKSLNISAETRKLVFGENATKKTMQGQSKPPLTSTSKSIPVRKSKMATPLVERIETAQNTLASLRGQLETFVDNLDDSNIDDESQAKIEEFNAQINLAERNLNNLKSVERSLAKVAKPAAPASDQPTDVVVRSRTSPFNSVPAVPAKPMKPADHVWRGLTIAVKHHLEGRQRPILDVLRDTYGENNVSNETRLVMREMVTKAATVPADTTTTGWAADLVTVAFADFMESLMPVSVYPQLASRGGKFTFGQNGYVTIPYREATPTVAGAFVLQGNPIPVKQGAFNSITLSPKKMAVISTFTREIAEHSTPAIEALIRRAILEDTAVAIDSVLLDATAASATRPAGLRNGVSTLTPTGGGGVIAAVVGDFRGLINALYASTSGNIRNPVLLLSPGDALIAGTMLNSNGEMPLLDSYERGNFFGIPFVTSTSVTSDTAYMIDAADFVSATGDSPRFDVSDQAVITQEDTTPLPIVDGSSTPAPNSRSLWQTDSLGIRMIMDINWAMQRTGMVQYVTPLGWN